MNSFKKVAFYTLGCKLNFSETSAISRMFQNGGYAKVDFSENADIYVINTCSVTDNADKKCRSVIRQAKKQNPESYVVVIGCYAQLKPREIIEMEGVDLVLGANEKFNIIEHVEQQERQKVVTSHIKEVNDFYPAFSMSDRTRTFLKVQDGCDYFCSFCTIPLARGKSRSNTIAETLKVASEAARKGAKEIVLTGVNIGDFGKQHNETFFALIQELEKIEGVERYRISSIEPNLLSDEIIDFVANSGKFAPHFHIPLQSGSDELLKRMRRKYNTDLYTGRVEKIKSVLPHASIGVDVIVGFPGETDEHFMTTYQYLNELDISYLHVFTYSERANTTAKKMTGSVPVSVRRERSKMLRILS
ncbi:MAG: tRNA (N(6)-L-threonylcarbamoyladenosine(37)-C(2))-methylthiotransferase MtaB, partial [Bacteroidetes bacterium]